MFMGHMLMSVFLLFKYRHDVAEVAGLASFSFGEDEESRYVMLFKKVWIPAVINLLL